VTPAIKIALVNYLNAKPFVYGFKQYFEYKFDINLLNPAQCADAFAAGRADIALIPVGALHHVPEYSIISDYCIGCHGEVRTVCVFSNQPIEQCHTIYLDNHSRTSVLLCQLLMTEYLGLHLTFHDADISQLSLQANEAALMIGDKVFDIETNFAYKYDLGLLWQEWQNLPFAFAVWIAKPSVSIDLIDHLNRAIGLGMSHISDISKADSDHADYFSKHISYIYSDGKKEAVKRFLALTTRLSF
jgi:chorismate dehydratase